VTGEDFERIFPQLRGTKYAITSPFDDGYNCIAFAAGDTGRWWWPGDPEDSHWPEGIPRAETFEAFIRAFELLGYALCESNELEPGWEKVAIYCDAQRIPTHAARQLEDGTWVSKLGKSEDIRHEVAGLEGESPYGWVAVVLRRARK
jgi:hypothetical protein